ncbi:MAG: hypothetical protein FJ290_28320 [Planctomycetes bacterium]|nr:hypothetical protein [Planctomycetota bacterium]
MGLGEPSEAGVHCRLGLGRRAARAADAQRAPLLRPLRIQLAQPARLRLRRAKAPRQNAGEHDQRPGRQTATVPLRDRRLDSPRSGRASRSPGRPKGALGSEPTPCMSP